MKKLLIALLFSVSLFANVEYSGICGNYDYDINITTSSFQKVMCADDVLNSLYYDGRNYRVVGLFVDPEYSLYLNAYTLNDYTFITSLNASNGVISQTSFLVHLLYGLSGILVGMMFYLAFGRIYS